MKPCTSFKFEDTVNIWVCCSWVHLLLHYLTCLYLFESLYLYLYLYVCMFVSLWVFVFVFVFVCVYSSLIISKCPRLPLIVNISARSKPQLPNWTFQHHTRPKISNSWRWHPEKILVCTLISLGRDKIKGFLMCAPAKILNWPPLPLIIQPLTAKASQIYSISNQLSIARLIILLAPKRNKLCSLKLDPIPLHHCYQGYLQQYQTK